MKGLYEHENKVCASSRTPPVAKVGYSVCEDCQKGEQKHLISPFDSITYGGFPHFPQPVHLTLMQH